MHLCNLTANAEGGLPPGTSAVKNPEDAFSALTPWLCLGTASDRTEPSAAGARDLKGVGHAEGGDSRQGIFTMINFIA